MPRIYLVTPIRTRSPWISIIQHQRISCCGFVRPARPRRPNRREEVVLIVHIVLRIRSRALNTDRRAVSVGDNRVVPEFSGKGVLARGEASNLIRLLIELGIRVNAGNVIIVDDRTGRWR